MEHIKDIGEFKIYKKKSGRYCIKGTNGKYINGDEKAKILFDQKLIQFDPPKSKSEQENNSAENTDS